MILHVDMDAFYAAVEERDRPELRGLPIIVGGTPEGRGVVAAANYRAREFGVHSALPASVAVRRCPQAVFLRPRMDHYAEVSREIRRIFERYTPLVQPLSLDEAFLDVASSIHLFGEPAEIGRQIKDAIRREIGLVASVGVAPNKFLAKLASDLEKPDGLVVVDPQGVQAFLDPLPVWRLWGVGKKSQEILTRLGIECIGQLREIDPRVLKQHFGEHGEHLLELAHGIDTRPVVADHAAKSISHETTFSFDVDDPEILRCCLLELTEQVARRLRRHGLRGRTIQMKIRYADFQTYTRAQKLDEPTNLTQDLWKAGVQLLTTRLPARPLLIRLLGVGVTGLARAKYRQQRLFDVDDFEKRSRLDAVTDQIVARFGTNALGRLTSPAEDTDDNPSTGNFRRPAR